MNAPLDKNTSVAVVGAGSMGGGIAQLAAQHGHTVKLFDAQGGAAAKAIERISADLDGAVQKGKLDAHERAATLARLGAVDRLEALAGCGLAVEAIVEKLEPKQALLRSLQGVLGADAVLATNTSSISITAVAQGLEHPQRVVGWHFFNPPTRMKLVEIIPGVQTDPALVTALHALSKAWGKASVDAPNAPGFIVNRVARPYYAEALRLRAERIADIAAIDRLLRDAGGFAMGPFELMDLIGLDVNLSVTESVFQATAYDTRYAPHVIQQELVRAGRFGRKSGRGFYAYGANAEKPVAPVVPPAPSARALRVAREMGLLAPWVERLRSAGAGITLDDSLPAETAALGDALLALTDGRTATERAAEREGGRAGGMVLLDLARDFTVTPVIGATASVGASARLADLAALAALAKIDVLALADVAGLAVMRIVCGLANEAADVMTWNGTKAADIDIAMRLGTAYPIGPLAWADAIGPARVAQCLANLQAHYGEVRYRRAPLLSRMMHAQARFHG
ncbi:MAG: 3-hydroxyacyl-CoA dehydrogenase [Burkholderiaceae bacterium]